MKLFITIFLIFGLFSANVLAKTDDMRVYEGLVLYIELMCSKGNDNNDSCAKSIKDLDKQYKIVMKNLKAQNAKNALKDHYFNFVNMINSGSPLPDEIVLDYTRRQNQNLAKHKELSTRLELETK